MDTAKAELREKSIAPNTHIRKGEQVKINYLHFYLKIWKKKNKLNLNKAEERK